MLPELFAARLEDFVRTRNAWAARLKEEGRAAEAAEVRRLRKPTPAVWAVNQLARRQPDKVRELVEAVEALRRAHFGDAGGLAQATERHRAILQDLLARSTSILSMAGLGATPDVMQRIANTLSGSVADTAARSELLPGRLTQERAAPGFETLAGDPRPRRPAGPAPGRADSPASADAARRARDDAREREGRARILERTAARRRRAADAASAAAEQARQRLTDLDRRAAEQRQAAEQATQAARRARQEAERAAAKVRPRY
jgi:hypothetical protein